jgi:Lar family restriction alleviation protein
MNHLLPCPFCGENDHEIEHMEGTILHPAYVVKCGYCGAQAPWCDKGNHEANWNQRAKLRAPVADERADDTLTQVYDRFGIGVLARNPSTLMACLGNVIRRANCLSQIERVLSVPTPPEPEDDGVWGEESLLRWGADEKDYAEHFKAALAAWSARAALASAPVAGEAIPTDAQVMKVYAETVAEFADGRGFEAGTVAFARAMLRRYAAPQASEAVRDALDAERWRAFIGSARIRPLGSAGLEQPDPNHYAHLGLEIWTVYGRDYSPELLKKMDVENERGRRWLVMFADVARAALSAQPGAQKKENDS